LFIALAMRFYGVVPADRLAGFAQAVPLFVVVSVFIFVAARLYERTWRYFSFSDVAALLQLVGVSAIVAVGTLRLLGLYHWLPISVPVIYWFVASFMLIGLRLARRGARRKLHKNQRGRDVTSPSVLPRTKRALLIGDIDWAEAILEPFDHLHGHAYKVVGLLDHSGLDVHLRIRGIRVLGTLESLEEIVGKLASRDRRPEVLIINASDAVLKGPAMVSLVSRAERLGLGVAKIPEPRLVEQQGVNFDLEFVNVTDLLGRPEIKPEPGIASAAIAGRRVMVTGAGGTIGSELVRQLARFGPAEIQLLDAGEYNLYEIDSELAESCPEIPRKRILCSIRQREALFQAFEENQPELVFHAAALKHVPLVEENPVSGVQTNVLGTQNVADAVRAFGALAMVQVSTDKAVNPVGLMGATKRLGELYCQAMDLAGQSNRKSPRFITVRFGNVLGSSGSLIPLFQRQLSRGGPLTVTHAAIERYFMTVQEAVQLILHGSAQALNTGSDHGKVFVLDMGEPIKILDLAKKMIRLAGLKPDVDIKIDIVGLRPGEKLYEELFDESEERLPCFMPGILRAAPNPIALSVLQGKFKEIARAAAIADERRLRDIVFDVVEMSSRAGLMIPATRSAKKKAIGTAPAPQRVEAWAAS
jgi:FlaA1/EpsC-like NDP-sugar epimerase